MRRYVIVTQNPFIYKWLNSKKHMGNVLTCSRILAIIYLIIQSHSLSFRGENRSMIWLTPNNNSTSNATRP